MIDLDWRSICIGLAVIGVGLMLFVQYAKKVMVPDDWQNDDRSYSGTDLHEGFKP